MRAKVGFRPHFFCESRESLAFLVPSAQTSPPNLRSHHSRGKGCGVAPRTERSVYLLFTPSSIKHAFIIAQACLHTRGEALNMASVLSALLGLKIRQGTQNLKEILTTVPFTRKRALGCVWGGGGLCEHPLCPPSEGALFSTTDNTS